MYSTHDTSDERLGSRVCVSAHRTRHRLERRRSTLSPRFEAGDMKVVSACSLCRCFPGEVAVAHSTLRRHFRCRRKQVRLFRVSPAHRILLILGALARRSTLGHLRAPFVLSRKSTWGRIRCMNPTRRTPKRTLVFTRRTGTCHPRTRESHRWWRARRAGRTRIRPVWHETMNTEKRCD
jgi:hypothetical protein